MAALSLVGGLSLHGLSLAAAYVAVSPIFVCYTLIIRPSLIRRLRYYHAFYILLLAAMVAGYLMVLARAVLQLRLRLAGNYAAGGLVPAHDARDHMAGMDSILNADYPPPSVWGARQGTGN